MNSSLLRTSLLALVALGVAPAYAGTVDVELENLLDRSITLPSQAPPTVSVQQGGGQLFVSVVIEGNPGTLPPAVATAGGRVRGVVGNFMTATLPLNAIRGLANRPDVRRIEAGSKVRPTNDLGNLPDGNASRGAGQTVFAPPYVSTNGAAADGNAGAGVIIAMVDSGLDLRHPDFIDGNGNTRVLYYWDHSDYSKRKGPRDLGFDYGREYDQAAIQDIVDNGWPRNNPKDTDGHGTHVMGTIGGNGSAAPGGPYAQYQFTGVAPKAKIIAVKYDFAGERNDSTYLVDAVSYIIARSGSTPCAINMSLGMDFGPHDGTTAEEQMLDAAIGSNSGKIVLCAAGNAGELGAGYSPTTHLPPADKIHGAMTIAAGETKSITFTLARNDDPTNEEYAFFDIWYDGNAVCDVKVTGPSNTTYSYPDWATSAGGSGRLTGDGAVFVYNGGDQLEWGTDNGDHEIYVEVSDYRGNGPTQQADLAVGSWTVEITVTQGTATFNGWHGLSTNLYGSRFYYDGNPTDNRMTIGSPATANSVVAVGAYTTRASWDTGRVDPNGDPIMGGYNAATFPAVVDDLAFFSSRGPSRDGRTLPHLSAPGVGIISCSSRDARASYVGTGSESFLIGDLATGYYVAMQGTSMACPNAAGVAALALAKNGTLTASTFLQYAQAQTRVDSYVLSSQFASDVTGSAPNNDWGAGKIDAAKLLGALPGGPAQPNNAPVADDQSVTVTQDTPKGITLTATDGDGDALTFSVPAGSGPSNGSLSGAAPNLTYTPNPGFTGTDSFSFEVTDGTDTDTGTVNITVSAPSAGPTVSGFVTTNGTATVNPGDTLNATITGDNFQAGATVDLGDKVGASQVSVSADGKSISLKVRVNRRATTGFRDVTVTNPDGSSATLSDVLYVN